MHHYNPCSEKSLRSDISDAENFCKDSFLNLGIKNFRVFYKKHGILGINVNINWKGLNYDYTIYFANGVCVSSVPFFDTSLKSYKIPDVDQQKRG